MAKKREWGWRPAVDNEYIIVDNRFEHGGEYKCDRAENKVWLKSNPNHKWTPLLFMDYSERFTWEEFKEYAQVIVDRLNAHEVEKVLKGDD